MFVSARPTRSGGFSLLEVVIASTLLLATVVAVTHTVVAAGRGGAGLERRMDADRAMRTAAERLRVLPFCAPAYPVGSAADGPPPADDLVAAVFPHGQESLNSRVARYVGTVGDDSAPDGSFVTELEQDGIVIRCVARFLTADAGPPLPEAAVRGWSMWDDVAPPSCVLEVRLATTDEAASRSLAFVRSALGTCVAAAPRAGREGRS
jgi:hypothetical protein